MGEALDDYGSVGAGYADAAGWWFVSVLIRLEEMGNYGCQDYSQAA